jgi:cytochrome c-type biogenesis protein CcmH
MTEMPRASWLPRLLTACFVATLLLSAAARVASADPLDDEARKVGKQLQCPICSGATVADSPSDLAGQMRAVIRAKLQAGESEQQIVEYFVERYGDGVLIEPPRRGISLLVWIAPVAMLIAGAVVLWRLLKGWLRPRTSTGTTMLGLPAPAYRNGTAHAAGEDASSSVDRARVELDRFRREG